MHLLFIKDDEKAAKKKAAAAGIGAEEGEKTLEELQAEEEVRSTWLSSLHLSQLFTAVKCLKCVKVMQCLNLRTLRYFSSDIYGSSRTFRLITETPHPDFTVYQSFSEDLQ